ncbi:uncharacterized protein SAPINGB_P006410 [Magnusiomyces paraingens]|uniref:PhoD-like phosphatase domain-containing protein n=1 Tax=Magnusiomyces paraingens TaxID=2606893 RepID=A0A5E8C4U3_9ASCO|nr:uncharacterized protein SAPINGB_P006410 [Saprochaete ingens]VVT58839.1 unnamed protein product [Saprochaete ingens]
MQAIDLNDLTQTLDFASFHQPIVTPLNSSNSNHWDPPPTNFRHEHIPRGTPPIDICAGPILRYTGQTEGISIWRGTALIVTSDIDPATPATMSASASASANQTWTAGAHATSSSSHLSGNYSSYSSSNSSSSQAPIFGYTITLPKTDNAGQRTRHASSRNSEGAKDSPASNNNSYFDEELYNKFDGDEDLANFFFEKESTAATRSPPHDEDNNTTNTTNTTFNTTNTNTTTNTTPNTTNTTGHIHYTPDHHPILASGKIPAERLHSEYGKTFWRFRLAFALHPSREQQVLYTINGDAALGDFFLPSQEQSMRVVFHTCNGFSLGVDPDMYKGCLWKDVLRHHQVQRFHVMIGGGDQIYCDRVKEACQPIRDWINEKNANKKKNMPFDNQDRELTEKFYLDYYIGWFGYGWWQGRTVLENSSENTATTNGKFKKVHRCLRPDFPKALATIPSINMFDDHDIVDGFGSYADQTMAQPIFCGLGQVAFKYYMLFQHHTHPSEDPAMEASWICNPASLGPYIHEPARSVYARLGKSMAVLALDCRTERRLDRIISPDTYRLIFRRVAAELQADKRIKHLLVVVGVPVAYPRLVWLETLLASPMVAGPIRGLAKSGILSGWGALGGSGSGSGNNKKKATEIDVPYNQRNHYSHNSRTSNNFDGAAEILDDLNDHWCAKVHKQERNQFVVDLQDLAEKTSARVTILAGDVHLAAVGRFYGRQRECEDTHGCNPQSGTQESSTSTTTTAESTTTAVTAPADVPPIDWERDHRLILNVVSSSISNAPPAAALADFLNTRNKVHYLGAHTCEDMARIFKYDVDGTLRHKNRSLMARRNWCSIVEIEAADPIDDYFQDYLGNDDEYKTRKPLPNQQPPQRYPRAYKAVYGSLARVDGMTSVAAGPRFPERISGSGGGSGDWSFSSGAGAVPFACDEREPRYPDGPGALSIVLHVERNYAEACGETRPYEVIAPMLFVGQGNNSSEVDERKDVAGFSI